MIPASLYGHKECGFLVANGTRTEETRLSKERVKERMKKKVCGNIAGCEGLGTRDVATTARAWLSIRNRASPTRSKRQSYI
jgi:hypothetical protein